MPPPSQDPEYFPPEWVQGRPFAQPLPAMLPSVTVDRLTGRVRRSAELPDAVLIVGGLAAAGVLLYLLLRGGRRG